MIDWGQLKEGMTALQPMLALWVAAFVILLGDVSLWRKGPKHINGMVAVVGTLVALILNLRAAFGITNPTVFAGCMSTDALAQAGGIIVLIAALLAILMATTYLRNLGIEHAEFYALVLLSTSGGMLMAAANDLIVLFVGLELLSFGLYVLAGYYRSEAKSEEASIKYFLLGAFASAFLLYGVALMYGATGTTNLDGVRGALSNGASHSPMLAAGLALLMIGLCFKAALVPFHQWTPDVYEGAPTPATAYMAGAAKIGAFTAMLRLFDAMAPVQGLWLTTVQVIAVLTMVFGNLLAVNQMNIKRMLAYSSIAHAGYLMVAVAVLANGSVATGMPARDQAMAGAVFYLFAYTFMTLGAFAVLVYLSARGRDYQRLDDVRGLVRRDAPAAYAMLFFMLSLAGVPPMMGFMGKWQIFMAAVMGHEVGLAIVMALTSVIGAFYYLRVVWVMCFEESADAPAEPPASRTGAGVSVLLAAAATVIFGIMPGTISTLTSFIR